MANKVIIYDDLDISEIGATWEESSPKRNNLTTVPRRHGALFSEIPVLEPRRIAVKGRIQEDTSDLTRGVIDTIRKTLARNNKKLKLYDDRFIYANMLNFGIAFVPGSAMKSADFIIDFVAADPFWYATSGTSQAFTVTTADVLDSTNGVYEEIQNIDNQGSAYVFPKLTFNNQGTGPITKVVLENTTTNRQFSYTGSIAVGNALVVDTAQFTVTNGGSEDLTNWSGSFVWLDPGINVVHMGVNGSGTINCQVTIEWTARWY